MSATKVEKLAHGHFTVARRTFRQISHAGLCGHRRSLDVMAAHRHLAGGGCDEPGDHAHGGGFAGTVCAQEAEHLARRHRETEVVDGKLSP